MTEPLQAIAIGIGNIITGNTINGTADVPDIRTELSQRHRVNEHGLAECVTTGTMRFAAPEAMEAFAALLYRDHDRADRLRPRLPFRSTTKTVDIQADADSLVLHFVIVDVEWPDKPVSHQEAR